MIPLSPRSAPPLFSFSLLTVALALQHLEQLLDALVARLQRLLLRLYPRLQLLKKQSDDDDLRDEGIPRCDAESATLNTSSLDL